MLNLALASFLWVVYNHPDWKGVGLYLGYHWRMLQYKIFG